MRLDLSADHLAWDNTEPATVETAARAGVPAAVYVPVAKGQRIRSRERSPSGGAYLGHERSWRLPVRHMEGVELRPGDVIEDADGGRWTVLVCELSRVKQCWRADCVNLALALGLRDTVEVQRAEVDYGLAGAPVKTFPPEGGRVLHRLRARVQPIEQAPADERGLRYGRARYDVIVERQPAGIDAAEDRLAWTVAGEVRHLDVLRVRSAERIDELPVIECEVRK